MMALRHNAARLMSEAVHQPTGNTALGLSSTSPEEPLVTILKLETRQHCHSWCHRLWRQSRLRSLSSGKWYHVQWYTRKDNLEEWCSTFTLKDEGRQSVWNVETKHTAWCKSLKDNQHLKNNCCESHNHVDCRSFKCPLSGYSPWRWKLQGPIHQNIRYLSSHFIHDKESSTEELHISSVSTKCQWNPKPIVLLDNKAICSHNTTNPTYYYTTVSRSGRNQHSFAGIHVSTTSRDICMWLEQIISGFYFLLSEQHLTSVPHNYIQVNSHTPWHKSWPLQESPVQTL